MLRLVRTILSSRLTLPAIAIAALGTGVALATRAVEQLTRELTDLDHTRDDGQKALQALTEDVMALDDRRAQLERTVRTLTQARDALDPHKPLDEPIYEGIAANNGDSAGWFDPADPAGR